MVVWGHSAGVKGDFFYAVTGHHMAAVAVKCFFFLSGLLVTNSILANQSPLKFAINRFFRIWPGLLCVLIVTAFIIGPIFTTLPVSEYFGTGEPLRYIYRMITLQSWGTQSLGYYNLPGLFNGLVNPPLWTIAPEVFSYCVLLAAFLVAGGNRLLLLAGASLCIADAFLPQHIIFYWLPSASEDFGLLPFSFAAGVAIACLKDRLKFDLYVVGGTWALYFLLFRQPSAFNAIAFHAALFSTMIWFATLSQIAAIKLPGDASYGVYLYGFLIQNMLASVLDSHILPAFPLLCLTLTILAGYLSWVAVERRAIEIGHRVTLRFVALPAKLMVRSAAE